MLPFSLSKSDAETINMARKEEIPFIVRTRLEVLRLLDLGYSRTEAGRIAGCHPNSVTNYVRLYQQESLAGILRLNYRYPRHELADREAEVAEVLETGACTTVAEASQSLAERFGYRRSREAVRKLLRRLGFKRRKTAVFPGKINDFEQWQAKQEAFVAHMVELMEKAENQAIDLVFGDAAHFVYGKFSHYLWSQNAQYRPSGHGRYRINVYGVYDVMSNQVYSMYNEGYINAEFMVEYLEWLREDWYQDKARPLHLILDNARYQHCKYVKEVAEDLNIHLEFLPGYSPNLNLIERLWKYLKKTIASQFHQSKEEFEQDIIQLLQTLNLEPHQTKLWNMLNPSFQRFEKSQILGW